MKQCELCGSIHTSFFHPGRKAYYCARCAMDLGYEAPKTPYVFDPKDESLREP